MIQERATFVKTEVRKDFLLYRGIVDISEVSDLLCQMIRDFPPNVVAFDQQITASGQRHLVTVIVQTGTNILLHKKMSAVKNGRN